ncbi:MAG: PEP/pyruvate-binding domain-containing protein [Spirochaetales bacterium]|nr:PEP/pyruvate-binding domain-containing protein [Spirochaetales bacterium]
MDSVELRAAFDRLKYGEDAFHELMRWRIRRVMLVMPIYDAWILEHDAKLSDQIVGEYHQLNLTTVPRLTTVSDGEEALKLLDEREYDLMIIGMRSGDVTPQELAQRAKERQKGLAVLLLLSSRSDLTAFFGPREGEYPADLSSSALDAAFLWSGDSRLFLAMIKYVEDLKNAPEDTKEGRVGVLLVVEDSITFYSAYLPLLYGELMIQTQRLIAEEMNDSDKYWRMRTRPKILLARNWEEALELGLSYQEGLIGIISDVRFRRSGTLDEMAGFKLADRLAKEGVNVPLLFQSSDEDAAQKALERGVRFQAKGAEDLHQGMRRFLLEELGFGDFVFRSPAGEEVARAKTLRDFELILETLPAPILIHHAERHDYSRWMAAHGEYAVARRIRPVRTEDFDSPEDQRAFLARSFREVREDRHRGRLVEFRPEDPGALGSIARYGSGSLGGKGRGLAFFNALLSMAPWNEDFAPLRVEIPRTLILATGEFDRFMEGSGLLEKEYDDDEDLRCAFLAAPLPKGLKAVLESVIRQHSGPIAVRSSSLLEDSQSLPFAGVYETYMIPGSSQPEKALELLCDAVRLVWSSTYGKEATAYRNALGVGREEEKMAVVVQVVAASLHGEYWFPKFSGTAQSLNYYPVGPMEREDGAARIAVGLGRTVVEGDRGYLFCPSYPQIPWGTEEDRWREGQTHYWGLWADDAPHHDGKALHEGEGSTLKRLTVREGEELGVLEHMVSTWDPVEHRLVDGMKHPGPRVVDFRDILDYEWLPVAPLLERLLKVSRNAMGLPVELEFAVDWGSSGSRDAVFSLLQVRPLVSQVGLASSLPPRLEDSQLLFRSSRSLGHGSIEGVKDVIWVDPDLYHPGETEHLRDDVVQLMAQLAKEGRAAVLIGPGRWGSRDRFLGIPVTWAQVSQAKLILEVARGPSDPAPSQGSHFFHNLVALGVGYGHIPSRRESGFVNWESLRKKSRGTGPVFRARFSHPLHIGMDGKSGSLWAFE